MEIAEIDQLRFFLIWSKSHGILVKGTDPIKNFNVCFRAKRANEQNMFFISGFVLTEREKNGQFPHITKIRVFLYIANIKEALILPFDHVF
ncbi:hypothetical protein D3C72_1552610 [compost metagenome]